MSRLAWNILHGNATVANRLAYGKLIETTMTIVRTCTVFNANDAVLLAGEYEDFYELSLLDDLPVALISESDSTAFELFALSRHSYNVFKRYSFLRLLWKLHRFIVVASSQPSLRLLLQRIKDSPWANFDGLHVLIDGKTEEHGCADADRFLWAAWEYDRISAIFLCVDPIEGPLVYTYNPYSSLAPNVWTHAGRFAGRNRHPWTLLKRKYRDDSPICEDLTFDKTGQIDGYEVRLNAISFPPHLRIDHSKTGLDTFAGENSEVLKIVFAKLNASLNVRVHNGTVFELGGIDSHGNLLGMLADVAAGEVDMGMNVRSLHAMWKLEHTYPHGESGLCVITQRAGHVSEFVKIVSFMSPTVIVANLVVFLAALCVLAKYEGFMLASLNVIRLITSVSMRGLPRDASRRIFFGNVFLLFLIINALHQSHWASLLTIPVPGPSIRTLEDLKASNYQIYGLTFHEPQLRDNEIRSRFRPSGYYECKRHVLRSRTAACLGDCLHLYVRTRNESLHRSRKIQRDVQVYVTRENWPLFDRVSRLIRNTVEAGLVGMWKKFNLRKMYRAWKRKRMNDRRSFRNLEIGHISFSFYILAAGHSCAAVVLAIEIFVERRRRARRSVD